MKTIDTNIDENIDTIIKIINLPIASFHMTVITHTLLRRFERFRADVAESIARVEIYSLPSRQLLHWRLLLHPRLQLCNIVLHAGEKLSYHVVVWGACSN